MTLAYFNKTCNNHIILCMGSKMLNSTYFGGPGGVPLSKFQYSRENKQKNTCSRYTCSGGLAGLSIHVVLCPAGQKCVLVAATSSLSICHRRRPRWCSRSSTHEAFPTVTDSNSGYLYFWIVVIAYLIASGTLAVRLFRTLRRVSDGELQE